MSEKIEIKLTDEDKLALIESYVTRKLRLESNEIFYETLNDVKESLESSLFNAIINEMVNDTLEAVIKSKECPNVTTK